MASLPLDSGFVEGIGVTVVVVVEVVVVVVDVARNTSSLHSWELSSPRLASLARRLSNAGFLNVCHTVSKVTVRNTTAQANSTPFCPPMMYVEHEFCLINTKHRYSIIVFMIMRKKMKLHKNM